MMLERVKHLGSSAYRVLKWPYRILNFLVRIVLLLGMIYAIAFSVAGTFAIYKAASFAYEFYEQVDTLRYGEPAMSSYMKALQDSSPNLEIRHKYVPLDSISPYLQRAVIASEDAGFYYHPGFDIRAIAEAMAQNQARGKTRFGGSTITQQLAKNLFLSGERTWTRKAKEIGYALLMEKTLGKRRILELYLNYAQWGQNMFGCEVACEAYYKKSCANLTLDQAIGLAAVLASPGRHNPHMRNSKFMESRRSVIYQNMFAPRERDVADSLMEFSEQQAKLLAGGIDEAEEVGNAGEAAGGVVPIGEVDGGSLEAGETLAESEALAGEPYEAGIPATEVPAGGQGEVVQTEGGGAGEAPSEAPAQATPEAPAEEPEEAPAAPEGEPQGSDGVGSLLLLEPRGGGALAAPEGAREAELASAQAGVPEPAVEGGEQPSAGALQHSESAGAVGAALAPPTEAAEAGE